MNLLFSYHCDIICFSVTSVNATYPVILSQTYVALSAGTQKYDYHCLKV